MMPQSAHPRRFPASIVSRVRCGSRAALLVMIIGFAQVFLFAAGSHHVIVISQMRFNPGTITVEAGDTVEWKNQDIFSHTVTADDGSFDSGLIDPGHSWQTTVNRTGTIVYHCRPHPNMTAQVIARGDAAGHAEQQTGSRFPKPALPTAPQHLHPILVNFTAALLPLALLSDLLGRFLRRPSFLACGVVMTIYAALITPLTAAAGWWWKMRVATRPPPGLVVHQWLGVAAVLLFAFLAVWRWRIYRRDAYPGFIYLSFALLVVLALIYQGSIGGSMVFGP
jgi:plastocyanin/uncharacterized membrane protein